MQQQNPLEDYRFIYQHLAPKELTGMNAHYDMAQELGRGTFATVMKAMARITGEWWGRQDYPHAEAPPVGQQ
jgi:serine/threonine/tyrosine protein kinase RAD53